MKKKRKVALALSLALCFCMPNAHAQVQNTTDKVVVSFDEEDSEELILNYVPDYDNDEEGAYFTVSLAGSDMIYNGYQMDIHLPAGMSVLHDEEDNLKVRLAGPVAGASSSAETIYPYTYTKVNKTLYTYTYQHGLTLNILDDNVLRVVCVSMQGESDFKATSGDLLYVYVKASPYMKPGDVHVTIDNVVLNHNEWDPVNEMYNAISYVPTVPCGGTMSGVVSGECNDVPLVISATNHWSTCILPFATAIPDGVKAYTSSASDAENIFLAESESIEAYTPYILYSEGGYNGTVSGTVDANNYPESGIVTAGNLTGAIVPQTVQSGYILQKHNETVMFYAIDENDSFFVPAGKCWMNIAANNAKALNFVVENSETAIEQVKDANNTNIIYDLTGRRINTIKQGGLYIKNGEKFINK